VAEPVADYAVALVRATRAREELRLGASPRASVALYRAAQAHAFLDGRGFVLPDDVKAVAVAVLAHRVLLDLDQQLRGARAADVIESVLRAVQAPPVETESAPAPTPADR
jgi:MoxR-like ATPase